MEGLLDWFVERTWTASAFAVVFATLVARYLAKRGFDRLAVQAQKTHNMYDDAVLHAGRKPIGWAVYLFGFSWAAEIAGEQSRQEIFDYIAPGREVGVILLLAWFAVRFISYLETHLGDKAYGPARVDQTTAMAVGKLLRASVVLTALLIVLQSLGFSVTGVLAFGGIGGIALGFAARDLLANFFGALMLYLDRPFSVGDWVRSSDRDIEGTVEEIGWRLTRIRTFDQRPLYVPNSVFASIAVENPQRMKNRRIYETIGVRYDDLDTLKPIIDDVREMLRTHPAIDTTRILMVNFVSFGPSSLDFFVYTFTKTTDWAEFHGIKEEILFRIAAIVAGHGAEVAFPTQTLHLDSPPEPDAPER